MTDCTDCPRNERQAEKIKSLWVQNARLEKRVEIQQWIIDRQRKNEAPTAREIAEQFFSEVK